MRICIKCNIEPERRKGTAICKKCKAVYDKDRYMAYKIAVFTYYGSKCVYCDESNIDNLQIDHTEGNGSEHRKGMSHDMYRWLINNDFPEGFQTLCAKHNFSKGNMSDQEYRQFIKNTYKYLFG